MTTCFQLSTNRSTSHPLSSRKHKMDPEQRFLQSRSSRIASETTTTTATCNTTAESKNNEEDPSCKQQQQIVALFWKQLKQRLHSWKSRCNDTKAIQTRQQLLDLQQELQTLRHYCLKSTITNTSTTTIASQDVSLSLYNELVVPDELPLADWRLLHEEFTNCTVLWETIQRQRFPKTKFVFDRYRQEVARRQALGIPIDLAKSRRQYQYNDQDPEAPSTDEKGNSNSTIPSPIHLESITNADINIWEDGSIHISSRNDEDNSNDIHDWKSPSPITSAVLLMKNLQNCTIQIHKVLEALHLVHITATKVVVSHPIASSIHITDCHDCEIHGTSQQLRIHESQNLSINVHLIAGAIIEGSHNIAFQRVVEVKDFDWLREGMASPNFRFVSPEETAIKEMHPSPKLEETISPENNHEEPQKDEEPNPGKPLTNTLPETIPVISPDASPVPVAQISGNHSSQGGDEDDEDEL